MRKLVRAVILSAFTIAVMIYVAREVDDTPPVRNGCVIDAVQSGDSLRLKCGKAEAALFQIAGLDAPNVQTPGCAAELAHGTLAMERLQGLIKTGSVQFEWPEGENTPPMVRLSVEGEDVAERLIREGLAVAYDGGARFNWCEKLETQ